MASRTRKPIRPRPAVCNLFKVHAETNSARLTLSLQTDLPAGTRLSLQADRPSRSYIWEVVNESIRITDCGNGAAGFQWTASFEELDTKGLNLYRHWKGRWPGAIKGLPDPALHLRVFLDPASHQFGARNRDLSGAAVEPRKNGHWVTFETTLPAPLADWLADKLP